MSTMHLRCPTHIGNKCFRMFDMIIQLKNESANLIPRSRGTATLRIFSKKGEIALALKKIFHFFHFKVKGQSHNKAG